MLFVRIIYRALGTDRGFQAVYICMHNYYYAAFMISWLLIKFIFEFNISQVLLFLVVL